MHKLISGNSISHIEIVSIDARDTVGEEKFSVRILRRDSFSGSDGVDATSTELR